MLSVFITPCANPTACHIAMSRAVRSTTSRSRRGKRSLPLNLREVVADHVVRQRPQRLVPPAEGQHLEGAEADVRGRHAQQRGRGLHGLALHRLLAPHHAQGAGGGDSQPVHGLAPQVLADGGAEHRAPVEAAGEGRRPRPLSCRSHRSPRPFTASPRRMARPSPSCGTQLPNWCPAYSAASGSAPGRSFPPPKKSAKSGRSASAGSRSISSAASGLKLTSQGRASGVGRTRANSSPGRRA